MMSNPNPYLPRFQAAIAEIQAVLDKHGVRLGEDYGNSYIFLATDTAYRAVMHLDLETMELG